MSNQLQRALTLTKRTREAGRKIREGREARKKKGNHILDKQWYLVREFGFDDPPKYWYRGHGYYYGVEHDDGEVRKLDHIARCPDDQLVDLSFTPYGYMKFADFKAAIDDLIAKTTKS